MTKKRAPGGGRKPQGEFSGKSKTLSTRITPALRQALERECYRSGWSLSQTMERLLWQALDEPERLKNAFGSRHNRALGMTISRIGQGVEMLAGEQWRENPYTFEALKVAVNDLLSEFRPAGDATVPAQIVERSESEPSPHSRRFYAGLKKPATAGRIIARSVLYELRTYELPRDRAHRHAEEFYSLPSIRYGLGLKLLNRGKK